jgi:signal transduction histidine kinase
LAALAATGAAAAAVAVALAGQTSARFDPATAIERTAAVLVTLALAALALAGAAIATRPTRRLRAVERIVAGTDSWGGLEARLRRTLGDAGLTIAYPLDDGRLVDAEGRPVDDESFHAVRHVTTISGPAGPLARVAHAHRLVGFDRRLGAAVRLTIDNERLNAALNDELRRLLLLRQRIVAAGERERRRIERNLHDGAQQHLVALILELGLAPYDPELAPLAPELAHVAATIDGALADLREVARGLYPAVLDGAGLGGAIADLARRAATPVVFTGNLDAHLPRVIEEAVYVAVREGLANVDAHAAASRATIDLRHTEEAVLTSVRDDGRGGAVIGDTGGLAELGDRVGALRGSVRVVDRPGKGTILEVRIPCE